MAEDKKWMLALGERKEKEALPFQGEKRTNPVQEIKEGIQVVQETKKIADELSGAKDLQEKLEETKEELEKARMEMLSKQLSEMREELKKATESKDMPAMKELEHKLEEAREALYKEQIDALRREIAELRKGEGKQDIADEIKKIRTTAEELGLKPGTTTEISPDIQLQLKKMDHELQLKLEEMRDERERRDKEWQLTLKKWEEERELRRAEIQQKYEAEKEKTETLKSSFDRAVRIIGRAVTEGEEETPGQIARQYHIEAVEGEMGEFSCPKCGTPVVVAPDANKAVCASCGFSAIVKRISGEKVESEEQVG